MSDRSGSQDTSSPLGDGGDEFDHQTWGIVAGRTFFRAISDMNDTKVQDSNQSEAFKRVIRNYAGPFGNDGRGPRALAPVEVMAWS